MKRMICSLVFLATVGQNVLAATSENTSTTSAAQIEKVNQPRFGVNLDPIWLVLGGIGAKFEYFVSDTVSLGVGGIYIPKHTTESIATTSTTTQSYKSEHNEIHLGTNIMLTGTLGTRGLYINPALGYQTSRISEYSSSNLSGSYAAAMARLTMGYQWILADHLRLAAGGGLTLSQSGDVVVKDSTGKEVLTEKSSNLGGLALDLQVGYVF